MTGVDKLEMRKLWRERVRDYIEFAVALIGVTSVILGAVWFVARNEVKTGVQTFIGIPELSQKIDRAGELATVNAQAIRRLLPPLQVAEYDTLRSRVWSPCAVGGECEYTLRVRRTEDGKECSAPTVRGRIVVDRYGIEYPTESAARLVPVKIESEWREVTSAFVVPASVPPGVAEYFLALEYNCGGEVIEQRSPRLVFEIVTDVGP